MKTNIQKMILKTMIQETTRKLEYFKQKKQYFENTKLKETNTRIEQLEIQIVELRKLMEEGE